MRKLTEATVNVFPNGKSQEMHSYGKAVQRPSHPLSRQERSLFGLTKPNIPHSFLPPSEKKKKDPNLLSDILETGSEKDSSLTGICKLHQLVLSIQLYLAKIYRGKFSDPDRLWLGLM